MLRGKKNEQFNISHVPLGPWQRIPDNFRSLSQLFHFMSWDSNGFCVVVMTAVPAAHFVKMLP